VSRCVSFWHKFEQEGNFCGMDPTEISRVKAYLEFVGKVEKAGGFDKDFIYENFTAGAARPLIATKDDETRTSALNYVVACLKRKERITEGDLKTHIKDLLHDAGKSCRTSEHSTRSEKLTFVKIPAQPAPEIVKEPQSEKPDNNCESLGDRVRAAEVAEAATNQPAPAAPIAAELKEKYNPAATTAQPPCLLGKPCPKCRTEGIRGRICDVLGVPVNQLPGNRCPFPADKEGAFVPASEFDPASGGRLIKSAPYKVIPVQLSKEQAEAAITSVIRGYLTKAQQGIWESIRKSQELGDTDLEIFEGLIDDAGGRVP
jgi:hypothetical protein